MFALESLYYNQANALSILGRDQEAVSLFRQSIEIDDSHAHVWKNLSTSYFKLGEDDSAVDCLEQALTIDSNLSEALISLGSHYIQKLNAPEKSLYYLEQVSLSNIQPHLVPTALRSGSLPLAEQCLRAHIDPEPRVALGAFLCENDIATACMDLSDGLAQDLNRLCRASGVGSRIEESALPIHPGVMAWEGFRNCPPLDVALAGGEDYELLFTVGEENRLEDWRQEGRVPVTRIGKVTEAGKGIRLVTREGSERVLEPVGWDHFLPRSDQRGT